MEVGRYRILEAIGRGGMAEVYRALAVGPAGFEKEVVVKRILPSLARDPDLARLIVDEAKIASRLDHPNIVQIVDLGSVDGEFFLVMEMVRGMDLARVRAALDTRGERVPIPTALRIVAEVSRALDYAHRQVDATGQPLSIVHRDVSPQNVLLSSEGAVKLGDFGIARATGFGGTTQAGLLKGKVGYVAPEQVADRPLDGRTDLYAAGIVLYELLTGEHPFATPNVGETLKRARDPQIAPPSTVDQSIDPALDGLVMRALARQPEDRYATAGEMLLAIEAYLRDAAVAVTATDVAALVRQASLTGRDLAGAPDVVDLDGVFADEIERLGADDTGLGRFTRTRDLAAAQAESVATTPAIPSAAVQNGAADSPSAAGAAQGARTRTAWRRAAVAFGLVALATVALVATGAVGRGARDRGSSPRSESTARPASSSTSRAPLGPSSEKASAPGPAPTSSSAPLSSPVPATARVVSSSSRPGPARSAGGRIEAGTATKVTHAPSSSPGEQESVSMSAPPPAPAEPGTLRIGSRPHWARIYVDGAPRGTTPLTITLMSGTYTVRASNPDLGREEVRRVRIAPGGTLSLVFDPF